MADNITDGSSGMVETHKGSNPRLQFFYIPIAIGFMTLAIGLVIQQVLRSDLAHEKEKAQSQRRILVPGPRGNIYDRNGELLVGNRPRFSAVLYLDELRAEIYREYVEIRKAYRAVEAVGEDVDVPSSTQMTEIARFTVVDRYLQKVNHALGRETELNARNLRRHFNAQRILPYNLIEDLEPDEYARLLEQLPVNSPLQVYTTSTRYYPHDNTASHVLGYVAANRDIEVDEEFPGAELMTFRMVGSEGRNGLETQFESKLQGEAGGTVYRVNSVGYRVESLQRRLPVQGENLITSLDIDLQLAAEKRMREYEMAGAAVALDVNTGEVLVMASVPDYNLNDFSPSLSQAAVDDINARGAWLNRPIQGLYPPGSSFKILVTLAGMRAGTIGPDTETNCGGYYRVGRRLFPCHDGHAHGQIKLHTAIAKSCNVFYYEHGLETGAQALADEARRLGFGSVTGIELPHESERTLIPDPAWKKERRGQSWVPGDTANMSIGQGDVLVTPLQMATFMASLARGQTTTVPHLTHDPERAVQRTAPLGLSPANYAAVLEGMEECTISGTSRTSFTTIKSMRIPGLRVAGKTGTAQKRTAKGTVNFAWFICFAPIERPQVAIAVMVEGDTPGEETGGGSFSAPVAHDILAKWAEKFPELIPAPSSEAAVLAAR
ncbi:penicillin-binding transpeptidase domain-containing protein [Synoicihabitans lomoniglobus]|uniref:Beta-lactamase n=1 Tax=Synoicihabitans lomoniglobus TaxID=2909285 RepID=A0AAE9ZQX4_9BACT|nr:peptidoglycan glycosyltransferase [Opitutaceae bacterium LMO-M01]WED63510.1 penicillin-binding transpeptidase domain-containing protein [Opitutaceae bacterium LMO-M01]